MKINEIAHTNEILLRYLISSKQIYETLNLPISELDIAPDLKTASLAFTPRASFQAYENMVHGGMSLMLLDSVAGVFGLFLTSLQHRSSFTAQVMTKFLCKFQVNEPSEIIARLDDIAGETIFLISAAILQKNVEGAMMPVVTADFRFKMV